MGTTITAPAGFFLNDAVTPETATDLESAVASAQGNVNNALTSETNAAASATAAAASATTALAAQGASAASATTAGNGATNATAATTTATTQATAAAASATAASTSQTAAATSETNAGTSATAAAASATAADNSATTASTQATNAATSATAAAASVSTLPAPSSGNKLAYVRITSAGNAYEARTPAQVLSDIGSTTANVGRNVLHNGLFGIWQRGTGAFTTAGVYTADRWQTNLTLDTMSVTRVSLADADRTAIGDEAATFALQNVFAGNAGASALNLLVQKVEGVRRLSGKSVTVSFWALAGSGTPKLGIGVTQSFGTGGSPSSSVLMTGQSVTLSTTWTRYSVTFAVPSVSGKTLGSNGDDHTQVNLYFSSGTTNATAAGTPGVQAATVQLWGVQAEVGATMTALEKPDPQQDLAKCQRFYQLGTAEIGATNSTGQAIAYFVNFPTTMRATPTVTLSSQAYTNASGAAAGSATTSGFGFSAAVTSTGSALAASSYAATADL